VETPCPESCTSLWTNPINVFADFLHMHNTGKMIWSTIHRNGTRLPGYFNRIEYWQFNFQEYTAMKKILYPGDRINTICMYDTTRSAIPVKFGHATTDEMCLEFMAYYPKLYLYGKELVGCGSVKGRLQLLKDGSIIDATIPGKRNYFTVNGNSIAWGPDNFTIYNPSILDPLGGELRTFGLELSECPNQEPYTGHKTLLIIAGVVGGLFIVGAVVGAIIFKYKGKYNSYEKLPLEKPNK